MSHRQDIVCPYRSYVQQVGTIRPGWIGSWDDRPRPAGPVFSQCLAIDVELARGAHRPGITTRPKGNRIELALGAHSGRWNNGPTGRANPLSPNRVWSWRRGRSAGKDGERHHKRRGAGSPTHRRSNHRSSLGPAARRWPASHLWPPGARARPGTQTENTCEPPAWIAADTATCPRHCSALALHAVSSNPRAAGDPLLGAALRALDSAASTADDRARPPKGKRWHASFT